MSEVEVGVPGSTPLPKGFSNTRGTPQKLHSSDIFSNVSFHFFTFFSTRAAGATPLHANAPHERWWGEVELDLSSLPPSLFSAMSVGGVLYSSDTRHGLTHIQDYYMTEARASK